MHSARGASRGAWWLAALQVQPGEGRRTGLMAGLYLLLSLGYVCLQTAAFGLFVAEYGAQSLPYAYITIAFVASLVAFLYLKLAERMAFARLLAVNLSFLAVVSALFWIGLATPLARACIFLLPVWFQVMVTLGNLAIWSLAGRVFDLREGKRLFALVGAGNWTGNSLAALFVPPLVAAVGTHNLVFGAALSAALTLLLLRVVTRAYLPPAPPPQPARRAAGAPARRGPSLLAGRYVRLIVAHTVLWWIAFYFVDNIFFDRAGAQFPDAAQLSSYVSVLLSGMGIVALITTTFLSARIIGRFGLAAGLMTMPALVVVLLGGLALGGALLAPEGVLFALASAAKLFNVALGFSLSQSATLIVYQAIADSERLRVQTAAEGIVQPLAVGLAGVSLLVLNTMLHLGAALLSAVFVVIGLSVLLVAWLISAQYPRTLSAALARRRWGDDPHPLAEPGMTRVLHDALQDPRPEAVIYALNQLEALEDPALPDALRALLAHPQPLVRREALARCERLMPAGAAGAVRAQLARESDAAARGAALRALLALDPAAGYAPAVAALQEPQADVRRAALVGLLRYGGIDGVLAAAEEFHRLSASPLAAERALAAQVLEQADVSQFYAPVLRLLSDDSPVVRRAALRAAGEIAHPRLWSAVIAACDAPQTVHAAVVALVAGGEQSLDAVEAALADDDAPRARRIALAQVCGQVRGAHALRILQARIDSDDGAERSATLNALLACGYRSQDESALRPRLHAEIAHAAAIAAHLAAFEADPHAEALAGALRRELYHARERVLCWLSYLADAGALRAARAALARGAQQAYALEVIDTQTPADLKAALMPLMEDLPPAERLARWGESFAQNDDRPAARLCTLIAADAPIRYAPWTVACALDAAGRLGAAECADLLSLSARDHDPRVAEAARCALRRLPGASPEGGAPMLSTVEKVLILKTVMVFSQTPDEVLADVADLLEAVDCARGETIIRKGDPGDSLYVIVDGRVSVRDESLELTTLGARDVFGEMALLDAEPRSATVVALEPTSLFRLAQGPFYELIDQRPEVVNGVLRVLVQRVRLLDKALEAARRPSARV